MFAYAAVTFVTRMLSDRSYLSNDYGRRPTSVLIWLLSSLIATFLIQMMFRGFGELPSRAFESLFGLSADGLRAGQFWSLLSYSFLHSTDSFVLLHLVFNGLLLWFLGRELLPLLGARRFLGVWFGAVLAGGLLWTAANWRFTDEVIGASGGVCGLLALYTCVYPHQRTRVLIFFMPVTVVPKYVTTALAMLDLTGFALFEASGHSSPLGTAHSVHLGGLLAGWLYYRFVHLREWRTPDGRAEVELPRWFQRAKRPPAEPASKVNLISRDDLKAEVDRILDKINSEGFASLTPDEKRLLDEARDLLSKS